jgi:hypothetical protein
MAGKFKAQFQDISAAADFLGNGAIEVNPYESEIVDLVRRHSIFLQRVDRKPATGHPHRYFEQLAIASAAFTDPRNISPTPTGPNRVERAAEQFVLNLAHQAAELPTAHRSHCRGDGRGDFGRMCSRGFAPTAPRRDIQRNESMWEEDNRHRRPTTRAPRRIWPKRQKGRRHQADGDTQKERKRIALTQWCCCQ